MFIIQMRSELSTNWKIPIQLADLKKNERNQITVKYTEATNEIKRGQSAAGAKLLAMGEPLPDKRPLKVIISYSENWLLCGWCLSACQNSHTCQSKGYKFLC